MQSLNVPEINKLFTVEILHEHRRMFKFNRLKMKGHKTDPCGIPLAHGGVSIAKYFRALMATVPQRWKISKSVFSAKRPTFRRSKTLTHRMGLLSGIPASLRVDLPHTCPYAYVNLKYDLKYVLLPPEILHEQPKLTGSIN